MEQFNIPVVLFCFKRTDTTKRVLEAIRKVQPRKMYILADQGKDKRGQVIDDCQRIACSVNAGCPDAEGQHHHRIQGKQFLLPSLHLQWCGLFFCFCVFLIFQ